MPGVISGTLFAFITSFDDVATALSLAGTEPRNVSLEMRAGVREPNRPTTRAAATLLVVLRVVPLLALEYLRRRNEWLRGVRA